MSESRKGQKRSLEAIEKQRIAISGIGNPNFGKPMSDETKAKLSAALSGRPGVRLGAHHTDEAKQKLRDKRALQVHPSLAVRGITLEMIAAANANNLRWCPGECKAFIAVEKFYRGGDTKSILCRKCGKSANQAYRDAMTPERLRERSATGVKYRRDNPDRIRQIFLETTYGVSCEWYEEKLREQDGHCALCSAIVDGRRLAKDARIEARQYLLVDHDHESGAVRGLLCGKCNSALHMVEYVNGWADRAVAYLERYGSSGNHSVNKSQTSVLLTEN